MSIRFYAFSACAEGERVRARDGKNSFYHRKTARVQGWTNFVLIAARERSLRVLIKTRIFNRCINHRAAEPLISAQGLFCIYYLIAQRCERTKRDFARVLLEPLSVSELDNFH